MISSQPWQFTIGLALGALLIGGITSLKMLEKIDDKPNYKPTQDQYGRSRSSFSNMFNYTTAARPVTRSRSNFGVSSFTRQPTRLDYNYKNRGTRSVNRGVGVTYNM